MMSIEELWKRHSEYGKFLVITVGIFFAFFWIINEYILNPFQIKEKDLIQKRKLIELQQEVGSLKKKLSSLEADVVVKGDVSWLLRVLADFSERSKLHVDSMDPLPVKNIPPYKYFPVKLKISGTFPQMVRYAELIDESRYLIFVESLKIQRKAGQGLTVKGQEIMLEGKMVVGFISG